MLRRLYDWLMALAGSRHAEAWLAVVAFAESSFFPLPPDTMLLPMCVAKPERAWRYATVCTVASVLGGILGYAIGYFVTPLGAWLLKLMGHAGELDAFQHLYAKWGVYVILIKGLTPIPYKLVTIVSGIAHFSFPVFITASIVTRGARFFLTATLLRFYGEPVRELVEKRLTLVTVVAVVLLVGGLLVARLLNV